MVFFASCDDQGSPSEEGLDHIERCDSSPERFDCQVAFVEDRGLRACWERRVPHISCLLIGVSLLDDGDPSCEEALEDLNDLPRLRGTCERLRGEPLTNQEALDEAFVDEMAIWVEAELEGTGELDPVIRFLTFREGFAAAIIDEVSDANRSYLRARDPVRRVLEEELRRAAE